MAAMVNQKMRINVLRVAGSLLMLMFLFTAPRNPPDSLWHETYEAIGILVLFGGVFGRFWSILYVGSRKNAEVVTDGPYSITRNPLYFFSTVATLGVGLMTGSIVMALTVTCVVFVILSVTARKEAAYLVSVFGQPYRDYAARVPFFIPNVRLFRTEPVISFSVNTLRRNFVDALVFLSFIPVVELLDAVKEAYIPPLLVLP